MRVIKRQEKARNIADTWYKQYCHNGVWFSNLYGMTRTKEDVHKALVALGPNPSADDVDAAIGNPTWTQCRCDECDGKFEEVVQVGQPPDYESSTAELCEGCLNKAVFMFKGALELLHEDRSK